MSKFGDLNGVSNTSFQVGIGGTGARSVLFRNANTGTLIWNPTATRTATLQDESGTIAFKESSVSTDISGISGASTVLNAVQISQANYDAIGVKDASTLYLITGNPDSNPLVQGLLTTESGAPVPTSADRTAQTNLYFTPWNGNRVTLISGTGLAQYTFTERTLALSGLVNGTVYDVFLFDSGGVLTMEAVAWTNSTTRASNVVQTQGLWVKQSDSRLLLGTFRCTATGQTEQSRTRQMVANAHNRIPRNMRRVDATASWTLANNSTPRQVNGSASNQLEIVSCLGDEPILLQYSCYMTGGASGAIIGWAEDVTSSTHSDCIVGVVGGSTSGEGVGTLMRVPTSGYHFYPMMERQGTSNATAVTFFGTQSWGQANGATAIWRC